MKFKKFHKMAGTKDRTFVLRISQKLLEEFREFCDENSINMSKRLRKYMENDIEAWKKRKSSN